MNIDDVLYSRQGSLELDVPEKVAVIGAGGVGAWVSLFAAMSGVKEITVYDDDKLELHNLNRLPYGVFEVGLPKVDVLAELIHSLRPNCAVVAIPEKATAEDLKELKERGFIIVDCTDSIEVQRMTAEVDPKRIRAGYDGGLSVTITEGPPPKWIGVERTGYDVTPSWVVGAAMAGAMAVAKLCKFKDSRVTIDIDRLMAGEYKE